jgi:UDP-N-acetylmuramate dehydrogenase
VTTSISKEVREALEATVKGALSWDVPMKDHTTIRVGGPSDCVFAPVSTEDVAAFVTLARRLKVAYEPLGAGSNLIVKDGGYRGVLVDMRGFDQVEKVDDTHLKAGAGVPLPTVVARARDWGMGGAEWICGIPGEVGGALAMNAGTNEGETFDVISEITVVEKTGRIKTFPRETVPVEYRSWGLERGTIATGAIFHFQQHDPKDIARKIEASKAQRKKTQPLDLPNAGCAFKNVRDKSGKTRMHAGRLIDELGLKGVRLRGAQVSELHANFIVNVGNATARDVLGLLALVRDKVKEAHGVTLESEWRVIGEDTE